MQEARCVCVTPKRAVLLVRLRKWLMKLVG